MSWGERSELRLSDSLREPLVRFRLSDEDMLNRLRAWAINNNVSIASLRLSHSSGWVSVTASLAFHSQDSIMEALLSLPDIQGVQREVSFDRVLELL